MQSQDIANLIINKLTQSQFNAITPNETELYLITDSALDSTLSDVSENAVMNKVIKSAIDNKQDLNTAVTHESSTAVGNNVTPVYVNSDGSVATISYTIAKSVPSDAEFTDTVYTIGTGLSLSGNTINHSNSISSGTVGSSTASSGSTVEIPYITYDAQGHITVIGTHTHTVTGFLTEHQDISGKANLSEVYTKSEINGKLSGAMHFKGTQLTVGALSEISDPQVGDMWNVKSTGANYAWDGENWDKLSEKIDLSDYQEKSTAVTHESGSAVGDTITPIYINSNGVANVLNYTIAKSVPSDAEFTDTTYTAGTGISISDDGVISNTQTSAEWGSIIGNLSEQSDLNTVLEGKQLISNLVTSVSSSSTDEQYPSAKLLYDKERVLLGRIWSNVNNPNNGWFTTTYNHNNGSYSQMFNESDGGGSIVFDKTANIISFIGANLEEGQAAGNSAVNIQIYSKDKTTNEGTRLNVSAQGIYYTKNRTNGAYTSSDELVTKADLSEMSGLTVTDNIVESSTDALTSGGAFTNLITSITANSVSSDSIDIVKANSVSTITINNVANATTSSKLGSNSVGSASAPIYLNGGTPTFCTGIKVGMLKG